MGIKSLEGERPTNVTKIANTYDLNVFYHNLLYSIHTKSILIKGTTRRLVNKGYW